MPPIKPDAVAQSLNEYGIALVIISFVLCLLFVYFWKMINQKSLFERLFESQNTILNRLIKKLDKVKDDILVIKTKLDGNFRTQGRDDHHED